jgi:hypothetical protein
MFFSETYKTHWWGPPRIASRALMAIPIKLGFTDNKDGHSLTVINPEWDVVYPVRNPYSRAVSWWNLRHNDRENLLKGTHISFEEFVKNPENEYFHIQPGRPWEPINTIERNNLKVRNIIRYEHLVDDLLEIDFVKENFQILSEQLFLIKYQQRDAYRREYIEITNNPVCSFYTQELADIVWENKKFEFLHGDYKKDSWKFLL